jgi:hypothetical protein
VQEKANRLRNRKLLINFRSDIWQLHHTWNMILRSESDSYRFLSFALWVTVALFKSFCTCQIFPSPTPFASDGSWRRQAVPFPARRTSLRPAVKTALKYFHLHKNGPRSHFRIIGGKEGEWTGVPNISRRILMYRMFKLTLIWQHMWKDRFRPNIFNLGTRWMWSIVFMRQLV